MHKIEQLLSVFVNGASRYFLEATGESAETGAPYLLGPNEIGVVLLGPAAVIGISGGHRGCIIFTAEQIMAEALVRQMGEPVIDAQLCADMIGEVANTISGNAREVIGSDFMISVPVMLAGRLDPVLLPRGVDIFVIPVVWRGHNSHLAVCLEAAP
ncbi:MAG: chemotaxis protein CheX [Verrucomicrobia bacterium]|nr:chemotaxis protein CheX [Verrucomicrobiota bacterium]